MFTMENAGYRLYKQTGFLVAAPGSPSGTLIPGDKNFQLKMTRKALSNDQVQQDGVEREFANGNKEAKATGDEIINLNYLGVLLRAICATSGTWSDAAFSGVYSIAVTNGGSGYTSAPTVTFTGGVGTGAAAVAIVTAGVVVGVVVTNPGTGYTSAPTIGFTGGGGGSGAAATATIDATKFIHQGTIAPGTPAYYCLEKGVSTYWDIYLNMVYQKMSWKEAVEGICKLNSTWVGSGHTVENSATLDPSTVEVTGTPYEYANLAILEGGAFGGVITELDSDIETDVKEKRIPKGFTGDSACASELHRGAVKVSMQGKSYFEDRSIRAKMRNGTISSVQTFTTSPDGLFSKYHPELKFEVEDWERLADGVMLSFKAHSIKKSSSIAPVQFTLINGTASY